MDLTTDEDIEILTVETQSCTVTSVYKPPRIDFSFNQPKNFCCKATKLVIGDFNCHSTSWGYKETDKSGEDLENWAESTGMKLIHDPKKPHSFSSGRWHRGFNPDNIFVSENIAHQTQKDVMGAIPHSQHRPIMCSVKAAVVPKTVPFKRRFNFKKAQWSKFTEDLDREVKKVEPYPDRYDQFVDLVKMISRRHIPRGCRTSYIPGLCKDTKTLLEKYEQLFNEDPFSEETIEAGEQLMSTISTTRREKWCNLVTQLDMKHSSHKAWKLLKNLSDDHTRVPNEVPSITPDQIAHNLLQNGKTKRRSKRTNLNRCAEENDYLACPFTIEELEAAMHCMKDNKAAGLDDIRVEQIKRFGPDTKKWILKLLNNCLSSRQIPKIWRKAKIVALLKPGKAPTDPKNFRPVSLLCHLYKMLERMILNRVAEPIDYTLIKEQAGFRPGKSCCGQVLNLTQHIENGYERRQLTGVAFIDLTAAYDTVNHNKLVRKIYNITKDYRLMQFIQCLLQNRRFFVTVNNKKSRWRTQKNGLPQGSVLAPLLYNIYTNDQPVGINTRSFIYADDTAVAAQGNTFEEVEMKLTATLEDLADYYDNNHLKPNPDKTQVCAFHLRNRQARRKLNVIWKGKQLQHCDTPKYLGINLDRTLTFKYHCENTKLKVSGRNNIIRKLTNSTWGAQPNVLRTSALALCFSTAEYAAPVWRNSAHTRQVDIALNETGRIITGCLRPTPVDKIYHLAGIAPPDVRRRTAAEVEKRKQENDPRHPMFGSETPTPRLKSRKSFLGTTEAIVSTPSARRIELWRTKTYGSHLQNSKEEPAPGYHLPYQTWKTLNRLRTGVTRNKQNLLRWGYIAGDATCECGELQDFNHLLVCPKMPEACTMDDLVCASVRGVKAAEYWASKSI